MQVYGGWASAATCTHQVMVLHEHRAMDRRRASQNEIVLELVAPNEAEIADGESWLAFVHRGSAWNCGGKLEFLIHQLESATHECEREVQS